MIGVVEKPGTRVGRVFFTVWTYGRVEVDFQYLAYDPAFSSLEARKELQRRLNAIPGVQIDDGALSARPRVELATLLHDDTLQAFLTVFAWVIERLREGQQAHDIMVPKLGERSVGCSECPRVLSRRAGFSAPAGLPRTNKLPSH